MKWKNKIERLRKSSIAWCFAIFILCTFSYVARLSTARQRAVQKQRQTVERQADLHRHIDPSRRRSHVLCQNTSAQDFDIRIEDIAFHRGILIVTVSLEKPLDSKLCLSSLSNGVLVRGDGEIVGSDHENPQRIHVGEATGKIARVLRIPAPEPHRGDAFSYVWINSAGGALETIVTPTTVYREDKEADE